MVRNGLLFDKRLKIIWLTRFLNVGFYYEKLSIFKCPMPFKPSSQVWWHVFIIPALEPDDCKSQVPQPNLVKNDKCPSSLKAEVGGQASLATR